MAIGHGSVILWRHCDTSCTSGCTDNVIFAHTEPCGIIFYTVAPATDVIASSGAGPTPLLRRIDCVVSYTTVGAETRDESIVRGVPGAEPAIHRCRVVLTVDGRSPLAASDDDGCACPNHTKEPLLCSYRTPMFLEELSCYSSPLHQMPPRQRHQLWLDTEPTFATRFLGLTRVSPTPNVISISSSVFLQGSRWLPAHRHCRQTTPLRL